jgi:hypothetical protein
MRSGVDDAEMVLTSGLSSKNPILLWHQRSFDESAIAARVAQRRGEWSVSELLRRPRHV